LPAPVDRPAIVGTNPRREGKEEKRKPDPKEPLCALVFKIVADSHGELFYLRIYSGSLKANSRPYNPGRDKKEFVSKLYHIYADPSDRKELSEAPAGDIVAVIGMKDSITGDTICDYQHPILLEPIRFARGVVSRSIEPESSADKQKLIDTLNLLKREDPTFDWRVDTETGQTLMTGMGVLHLEVKQHRMERDFRLGLRVGKPRVSYRETIRGKVEAEGSFERHLAGTPVRARVRLSLKPGLAEKEELARLDFDTKAFPPVVIQALRQGISGSLESGWYGYPVINLHASVTKLELSSELPFAQLEPAIQAAANEAVQKALRDNIVLLEPMMRLEVTVPEEYLGAITADLNARKAEIEQLVTRGKLSVIEVLVPLARMFDYSDKVRSLSQGRAGWTMEPESYAPVSNETFQEVFGTGTGAID
jgi:elongation factor G